MRGAITRRCGEQGGYEFELLEVYVVDLARNEQVMAVGGSGYSEGCLYQGKVGTLCGDLADLLKAAWPK